MGNGRKIQGLGNMQNAILPMDLTAPGLPDKRLEAGSVCWELDRRQLTLTGRGTDDMPWYEIDLDRCRDSAEVLDWIVQVSKKTWASWEVIAKLVLVLDQVLDLQGAYCSCGVDQGRKVCEDIRRLIA